LTHVSSTSSIRRRVACTTSVQRCQRMLSTIHYTCRLQRLGGMKLFFLSRIVRVFTSSHHLLLQLVVHSVEYTSIQSGGIL